MATLWCVAGTFSLFAADNNKWKPLFGKNLENANYNPEVWSETDGVLGAVKDEVVKKPGEWNHMRIKCSGQHIMVILNGKKVTEMDMSKWTSGTKNPDGSDIPSWLPKPFAELPTKGFIGLQGKHGDSLIWFRNIKIRSL